ncbi:MAG: tetratricopeptide repeat protein [Hyphomicrobiaceae bacterium]
MFGITLQSVLVSIAAMATLAAGILFAFYRDGLACRRAVAADDGIIRHMRSVTKQLHEEQISEAEADRQCREHALRSLKLAGASDQSGNLGLVAAALLLGGICVSSLAGLQLLGTFDSSREIRSAANAQPELMRATVSGASTATGDELIELSNYLTAAGTSQLQPKMSKRPSLPGVDELIARLAERLRNSPDDAEGWRMLGWSYFHTDNYAKAIESYERALKLRPDSQAFREGLAEAKKKLEGAKYSRGSEAGQASDSQNPTANEKGPTAADIKAASQLSSSDRQAMIESMVSGLATRLEESPRDPEGWQKLIRSRAVLGQHAKAQDALSRALNVFANEPDVQAKLIAAAGKLGVSNPKPE